MPVVIETSITPAERLLLEFVARNDVALDDVMALGSDLRRDLTPLSAAARAAVMDRLSAKAASLRQENAVADAVMIEMIVRSLKRFFR